MRHRRVLTLAAAAGLLLPEAATAQTATATMEVTATVAASCSVSAGAMEFGTIERGPQDNPARAALSLSCTPNTAYAVVMDEGRNGARRMVDPASGAVLAYDIFQDAAGTRRWDRAAPLTGIAPATGQTELVAYGRITSSTAAPGRYSDLITVTVAF